MSVNVVKVGNVIRVGDFLERAHEEAMRLSSDLHHCGLEGYGDSLGKIAREIASWRWALEHGIERRGATNAAGPCAGGGR